jgi:hypothetical protein
VLWGGVCGGGWGCVGGCGVRGWVGTCGGGGVGVCVSVYVYRDSWAQKETRSVKARARKSQELGSANVKAQNLRPKKERKRASAKVSAQEVKAPTWRPKKSACPALFVRQEAENQNNQLLHFWPEFTSSRSTLSSIRGVKDNVDLYFFCVNSMAITCHFNRCFFLFFFCRLLLGRFRWKGWPWVRRAETGVASRRCWSNIDLSICIDGQVCWNSKRRLPFIVCRPRKTNLRFPFSIYIHLYIEMVAYI